MKLAGETAIVTGAGQGLGEAIARALAAEGAQVAVTDVAREAAARVAEDVPGAAAFELDVRNRTSVDRAVAAVAAALGEPTLLVNNAGVNRVGPSEALPEELWQLVLDTNLSGAFRCSQVVGARMLAAGRGAIVNVASISAEVGMPGRAAYCAAKAGLVGMTRALAVEWAGRGVRVNAVAPGYVVTPLIEDAIAAGYLSEEGVRDRTPAARLAEPGEIAGAVAFLLSAEAGFVTGETLAVDGGYLAYGAPAPASVVPTTPPKEEGGVAWSSG